MIDLLKNALHSDGFRLFAQLVVPLAQVESGMHAEVLLRLDDGEGGLILPGQFLPCAHDARLGAQIDTWVVDQALRWLDQHRGALPIELLSINLSRGAPGDAAFCQALLLRLEGLEPDLRRAICLEVGESGLCVAPDATAALMRELQARGVRVALDDFAGAPDALARLADVRFDFIKIDALPIARLGDDPQVATMVRRCVSVARAMGAQTVAEGVETSAVLEQVRRVGIDYAQGVLLAPPAPISELSPQGPRPRRAGRELRP